MNVSYVITVYDKAPYLPDVMRSLAWEHDTPPEAVEYIFVDDGSRDGSLEVIREHQALLPGEVIILSQQNRGAAAATNAGAARARHDWLRLLDGDDIVCRGSTAAMHHLARAEGVPFVIGDFGSFSEGPDLRGQMGGVDRDSYVVMSQEDALARFIRNFSHNSSCMLIEAAFFAAFGGADARLMSPDYSIALRATARADRMVRMTCPVARTIEEAPGRLSSQIARSRYDSIMAIYSLAFELMPERPDVALAVYRRACSRSYRYARHLGNRPFRHFLRYLRSRIAPPRDLEAATRACLAAYTPDGSPERPPEWVPGAKTRAAPPS